MQDQSPPSDEVARTRKIAEVLLRQAKRARDRGAVFFEVVMREEGSRARIKAAPHQRVVLQFMQDHPFCVLRLPPGFSKTYMLASEIMRDLGNDPTSRAAVISAAQGQAAKPLAMVRDYIEDQPQLRLVFPSLQRSSRRSDPWTQTKITIERPRGIRDPSLSAVGFRGKLPGARLKRIYCDDLLTAENTATPEAREGVRKWFHNTVLPRLNGVKHARCVVSNTPYHPDDLTYVLQNSGWPTLEMTIDGKIRIYNDDTWDPRWRGVDELRPSDVDPGYLRLTAHDHPAYDPVQRGIAASQRYGEFYDVADEVFLWPELYDEEADKQLRRNHAGDMHQYWLLYHSRVRNDEDGYIRFAWVERCKELARQHKIFYPPTAWAGPTYTGVDVGIGQERRNDPSSVFTFGLMPDNTRVPLRIDTKRYSGGELIDIIAEHHRQYGSQIRVETNGAQMLLKQWALERDKSLPIKAHHTGKNKHSREAGVASVFIEIENGAWLIPNDPNGVVHESIQAWLDAMFFFDASKHTPDVMIACWLARMQAWTKIKPRKPGGGARVPVPSLVTQGIR